jgi:hypothetical protein
MSVPAVAGGRTAEQFVRYLAQQVAASGSAATDFNRLSVLRTIAELQALLGERFEEELLVMTAEGIDRAAYRSFGFNAQPAAKAYGTITFRRTFTGSDLVAGTTIAAVSIPLNTIVRVTNTAKNFSTYQNVTFAAFTQNGITPYQELTTTIVATGAGSAWNTNAGTITEIVSSIQVSQGVLSSVNNGDIITGANDEDDEQRRLRFSAYIQGIHRATSDAIEYGILQNAVLLDSYGVITEKVSSAQVIDGALAGTATCYVWNGAASTAPATSPTLHLLAQKIINGYIDNDGFRHSGFKAAGANITISDATIVPASVSVSVYPAPGMTLELVKEGVRAAILRVFARMNVGDDSLKLSDLRYAVGTVRGIIDHAFAYPFSIANPILAPTVSATTVPGGIVDPTLPVGVGIITSSTPTTFGTIGTYNLSYTYYSAAGETPGSPSSPIVITVINGQAVSVPVITVPSSAIGVKYYIAPPSSGVYTLAGTSVGGAASILTAPGNGSTVMPVTNTSGVNNPGVTPVLTATAPTSTFGAGSWGGVYTFVNAYGETVPSAIATVTITATQSITFAAITLPAGATGVRYYLRAAGGSLFYFSNSNTTGNAIALSTNPQVTLAPSSNTTGITSTPTTSAGVGAVAVTSTLTPGLWGIGYTLYSPYGETIMSPPSFVTIAGTNVQSISVPNMTLPANTVGVRFYLLAPSGTVYGLSATSNTGAAMNVGATPIVTTNPPIANGTGLPIPGASFLTPGKYQVSYAWSTSGGQSVSSADSSAVNILGGQALRATIPGTLLDPVLPPTLSTTPGSTLPAGSYSVGYTYYNAAGETILSPVTSISLGSPSTTAIVIGPLGVPSTATGVRYYVQMPSGIVYGYAATSTNGASVTVNAPSTTGTNPPVTNTTGVIPVGATGINWFSSINSYTITPTLLAFQQNTAVNSVTIPTLPLDPLKTEPTGNTSANIGGGVGKIIVPINILVTQGT